MYISCGFSSYLLFIFASFGPMRLIAYLQVEATRGHGTPIFAPGTPSTAPLPHLVKAQDISYANRLKKEQDLFNPTPFHLY